MGTNSKCECARFRESISLSSLSRRGARLEIIRVRGLPRKGTEKARRPALTTLEEDGAEKVSRDFDPK
jgi:hypothetical protein